MTIMTFDWPYLVLRTDGVLVYEDTWTPVRAGDVIVPRFHNRAEAEQWLIDNDVRGSVR